MTNERFIHSMHQFIYRKSTIIFQPYSQLLQLLAEFLAFSSHHQTKSIIEFSGEDQGDEEMNR
jgi:hypothetical protein